MNKTNRDPLRDAACRVIDALREMRNLIDALETLENYALARKLLHIYNEIDNGQSDLVIQYISLENKISKLDKNVQEVEEIADNIRNGFYNLTPDKDSE